MTQDEIEAEVRRAIYEPHPGAISSAEITTATLDAVNILGAILLGRSTESFITRKSLQSLYASGPVFAVPAASHSIQKVWDMDDNALAISGAADNGSTLIRVTTSDDHDFVDDDLVTIHDVGGTTEANGTFMVTYVDDTNFDLQGSTFANTYSSGGYVFKEDAFDLIRRMPSQDALTDNEIRYYLRGSNLIVDDNDFENDIIVSYVAYPSTLAEIPTRYHFGLPGYCVMKLIKLPPIDNPLFVAMQASLKVNQSIWETCRGMAMTYSPVMESINISESTKIKRWI